MRSGHFWRGHCGRRALPALQALLFSLLAILIARTLIGWVALLVQPEPPRHEKLVIAFFWSGGPFCHQYCPGWTDNPGANPTRIGSHDPRELGAAPNAPSSRFWAQRASGESPGFEALVPCAV